MATALQKTYSIVIRVENIQTPNGDLQSVDDISERERIIKQFFVAQYGEGEGRLGVRLRKSKVKLSWFPSKADSQAEDWHVKALADAKDKNYPAAINSWVKAISINSADPDYYFNLGVAFFELKNYRESIENLQRSVQICPIYYKSHLVLGTVFIKERKFTEAERHLRETLKFNPNIAFAYLNLGAVCSILKRYDEGIQMFTQSLKLSPNEVKALFGLGKIYSIIGDSEKANDYFAKLLQIDPTGPLSTHAKRAMVTAPFDEKPPPALSEVNPKEVENLYQHAYRAYLFTDYDRSIQLYSEYVKRKSDDDFVWFSLAEAYLRAGMIEKAVNCYEKAISLNHTKALYFKELAIAFNYLNQEDKVINCLNKAKQLGKSDSLTHTLWGKILIKQKEFSEAIDNLTQAIKMNPNNLLAKYYLAVAFRKTNDVHAAINSLQEIIAAPIDSPLKVEAEGLLGEIN